MPVYRDKQGNVIEVKTRTPSQGEGERTQWRRGDEARPAPSAADSADRHESATRQAEGAAPAEPDDRTRVVGRRTHEEAGIEAGTGAEAVDPMEDPLVGWLVVIEGPGRGRNLELGYGTNSIGRGRENRLVLDFGDREVSRSVHANVTYDPRSRRFFVQHGEGRNLTYLDGEPVLQPTELQPGAHLAMGDTTLRFVPFCGGQFDWQDMEG